MRTLLLLLALVGCAPADDLTGDWYGPADCEAGIELDVSLWFEVLSGETWRGESFLVWDDIWEDEGWRFRLFMDVEARLRGSGDSRILDVETSACEASPYQDWACPAALALGWEADGPSIAGSFEFGVPVDGDWAWSECRVELRR